ncbi:proteasome subunit beta type-6 [Nannochloropsis oceanica]
MLVLPLVLFPLLAVAISFPGHEYFSSAGSSLGLIDDEPPAAGTRQDHSVVSTGTTMVAAKYRDGVIVGADSRSVKNGRYVLDRFTDKVLQVSEHVVLACSGRTAIVQRLSQELVARLRFFQIQHQRLPTSQHAAALLRILLRVGVGPLEEKEQRSNDNTQIGMDTDALAAGWSPAEGPRIHQVLAGGTVLEARDYAVAGSGATYIVGFMDMHYPQAEEAGKPLAHTSVSREECEEMVKRALALAGGRDTHSGGNVTIAVVDAQGVKKQALSPGELQKSLKQAMSAMQATAKKRKGEEETLP